MKNKNSIPALLFISLMMNILHPLLGRWAVGEASAQQKTWQTLLYNKSGYNWSGSLEMSIDNTRDSGFVMVKHEGEFNATHIILSKLNKYGGLTWSKDLGVFSSGGIAHKVIEAYDGGYMLVGGDAGNVIKTDNLGTVKWSKAYGKRIDIYPGEFCTFTDIKKTIDSGYVLTGRTSNFGTRGGDMYLDDVYLVKMDTAGAIEWTKTYGTGGVREIPNAVKQTPDSGYIICGQQYNSQSQGAFLFRVSSKGILKWSKSYTEFYLDPIYHTADQQGYFNDVTPTLDGGYIATGGAVNGAWIVKTNGSGTMEWTKEYDLLRNDGCGGWGIKIYQNADSTYLLQSQVMAGIPFNGACANAQPVLLYKLNASGEIIWERSYGSTLDYAGSTHTSVQTLDGGLAVCSYASDTLFAGYYNPTGFTHIIKVDSLGKNGNCQTTLVDVYTVQSVVVNDYSLTQMTGTMNVSTTMTATTYTMVVDTNVCFNAPIVAAFRYNTACLGDSTIFYTISNAGIYNWNFGDPTSGTNNTYYTTKTVNPKHLYNAVGTYTVSLLVSDGSGSPSDSTVEIVTILPRKFISVSGHVTVCSGDSTLLKAPTSGINALFGFEWLPKDSLRNSYDTNTYAYPAITTTYKASAYNGGCWDYDSLTVSVIGAPTIAIYGNGTVCQGDSAVLSATGGNNYLWNTGETINPITVYPPVASSYTVIGYTSCSGSGSFYITVLPGYTVSAGENITINKGSVVTLNGTGGSILNWTPGLGLDCEVCINPQASPSVTTTYYLTAESAGNKCTTIDSVVVYVINCNADVFVPNAFSPNADNINDQVIVRGNDCIQAYNLRIYDRWGEKVFESNNMNTVWDGTYKNKKLNSGVFVYYLEVITKNGETISQKGNISLIR